MKIKLTDLSFVSDLTISKRGGAGVLAYVEDFDSLPTVWRIRYGFEGAYIGLVYVGSKDVADSIVSKLKGEGFPSITIGEVPALPLDPRWEVRDKGDDTKG